MIPGPACGLDGRPTAPAELDADLPFVSVIVPTWNRVGLLRDTLQTLVAQDYPAHLFEVLVVDDGSTDGTPALVSELNGRRGLPSTLGISRDHAGLNAARNAGIAAALGDPVCFVDDDVNVPTTWLSSMVAALLRHPGPVCVGGAIRLELEVPPPRVCERHSIGESELDLGPVERPASAVWGANMSMWRSAFLTAGTFDERLLIGGEETEWERRLVAAGGRIIYAPDAWLLHRRMAADLTLTSLLCRTFRRGLSCGRNTVHTGERQRYPEATGRILGYLRHAATARCSFGLICTSMATGFLLGQASRRWAGRSSGQRPRP